MALAVTLLLTWLLLPYGYAALPGMFLVTTTGSVLALGLMLRLIDAAEHAETLGAALSHGSLNIGNALGAWLGGVTIAAGYGYRSPLLIGALLSLAGFVVLAVAFAADRSPARPLRGRHVVEGQVDPVVTHLRAVPLDAVQTEAGRSRRDAMRCSGPRRGT